MVNATAEYLRRIAVPVHATAQPSGTELGTYIRAHVDSYEGMALACLVAADRHQQQRDEILPHFAAGQVVMCDRYLPSSLVLQVLDGVAPQTVWALNSGIRRPNVSVILRADADTIGRRLQARGAHNRFESDPHGAARELEQFDAVVEDLVQRGWPVCVLDCSDLSPRDLVLAVANTIVPLLPPYIAESRRENTCS